MPHLPIFRCLLLLFALSPALRAQSFLDWKGLRPGPHAVGFKAVAASDASRTFMTPTDYFGRPRPGFGNRPVQIAVWYPAEAGTGGAPLTYGDYVALLAWELGEGKTGAEERLAAENRFIQEATPKATPEVKAAFGRLFREAVWARRDAKPAAGKFPVLICAPGGGYPAFDNSVMAEYLASHGFIVITSPSLGPDGREMPSNAEALDAESRDMEFLAGYAQSIPQADPGRLAAMGYSLGGAPAALFALRNARVRALISLDGVLRDERYAAMAGTFPQFRPERLRVPLLWIACAPADSLPGFGEGSFQEKAVYADLAKAVFPGIEHHDFSSMASLQKRRAGDPAKDWSSATAGYEAACRIILGFLESRLNGTPRSLGCGSDTVCAVTFRQARKAPPSVSDIRETLDREGLAKAAELVQIVRREQPEALPSLEDPLNAMGYEALGRGQTKTAIGLFSLAVELFPDSFNASDSLGEGYLAEGDLDRAERLYGEALSKLEKDPRVAADQKAAQRARIDKVLVDIRARKGLTSGSEIHDAAATGDLEKVKALLAKDPALVNAKGEEGLAEEETPLLLAIYGGHIQTAEYMIARGADVNAQNGRGLAPLNAALSRGLAPDFVRLLVEKGADVNHASRYGESPLDIAAGKGQVEMTAYLESKGARPTPGGTKVVNLPGGLRRVAFEWGMRNNVVVLAGSEGALLVDSGFSGRSTEELRKAVAGLSKAGIRHVVNTHDHGDHSSGNGLAGPEAEAIGFKNLAGNSLDKVVDKTPIVLKGEGGRSLTAPYTLRFGGQAIRFIPNPGLHSGTDVMVYFQQAGVLCMGDLLLSQNFPAVHDSRGYLAFLDIALDVFPRTTIFVSGHGRDLDWAGLSKYRDMLREAAEVVRGGKAKGVTAEQMIQAHVLKAYEVEYSYLEWLGPQSWIRSVCGER